MKPIKLEKHQLKKLMEQIKLDYPKSVYLIRERMKEKLGFVHRTHRFFTPTEYWQQVEYLDFYSENKRTMFILKYSDIIGPQD